MQTENQPSVFLSYYRGCILRPGRTFAQLIKDKGALRLSFYALLIQAVLYTFVYIFLIFGKGSPFSPWLNIAPENYYKYNVIFLAPSMILGWILAAGVVHLIARLFSAGGAFEEVLSTFGFGISIASWSTGIHDLLTSFLGAIHVIDQHHYEELLNSPSPWRTLLWIQMIIYLVWFVILFSKGVKQTYLTSMATSIFLGLAGFVVYQGFFFIFNR